MYSQSSDTSTSSGIAESETDNAEASFFSEASLEFTGLNWELKDLLNKDDKVGSDCLEAVGAPAKAAGWKDRLGMY